MGSETPPAGRAPLTVWTLQICVMAGTILAVKFQWDRQYVMHVANRSRACWGRGPFSELPVSYPSQQHPGVISHNLSHSEPHFSQESRVVPPFDIGMAQECRQENRAAPSNDPGLWPLTWGAEIPARQEEYVSCLGTCTNSSTVFITLVENRSPTRRTEFYMPFSHAWTMRFEMLKVRILKTHTLLLTQH